MKDLFTSFLSTGAIQVANLVTGIVAARLLLPDGRGELAFLVLWPSLIADISIFGVSAAASYHMARGSFGPQRIFAATTTVAAILGVAGMAVYLLLMPVLFADHRPELTLPGLAFVAFIPLQLLSYCISAELQGAQQFTLCNAYRAIFPYAYALFIGAGVALVETTPATFGVETTPATFAYAYLLALVAAVGIGLAFIGRLGWISLRPDLEAIRATVVYGARYHVSTLLEIASRRLDFVLITIVLPPAQLGLYVVAMSVQGIPMLVTTTMSVLLFPKIAAAEDEDARQRILARYVRATLAAVLPATALLIAVAPWLIRLVFGPAFAEATDIVRILLLAGLPFVFRIHASIYFRAANRMAVVSKAEMIGMAVSAASLIVLIPALGILGAALAQLVASVIPAAYIVARARSDHGLRTASLFRIDAADADLLRDLLRRATRGRAA